MVCAPRCLVLTAALLAASGLIAQTVYKSVDEKGNVIYSENPPAKTRDGKIRSTTELPIDPNQNVFPAQQTADPRWREEQQRRQAEAVDSQRAHAEAVAAAQTALEAAEAQLKTGSEVQPGDFMGKAGGGVGPSLQRLQRLDELQRAVDEARQNLERLQGGSY